MYSSNEYKVIMYVPQVVKYHCLEKLNIYVPKNTSIKIFG